MNNVHRRLGQGITDSGQRVVSEHGARPEKTINSRQDFAPVLQITDKYDVRIGVWICEYRHRFRLGLSFQDVGSIVPFHEVMQGTARSKQDESAIDYLSAFVFPPTIDPA